jgi:hypothetical protein
MILAISVFEVTLDVELHPLRTNMDIKIKYFKFTTSLLVCLTPR